MKTINLKNCTFLIPVKVEHSDRYRNAYSVLGFLNHHFKTNVIIYEASEDGESRLDFLGELKNLNIKHTVNLLPAGESFHRTKYLNIMLEQVETPVVANYDIDVILPVESYVKCRNSIIKGKADVYYPYVFGRGQYQIPEYVTRNQFNLDFNPESLLSEILSHQVNWESVPLYYSEYGHCIFFDTETYRKGGGENEEFKSYGPEDKERGIRFKKLGYSVKWLDSVIFHFEHHRGNDSSQANPYIDHNNSLFKRISEMSEKDLEKYYSEVPYRKEYEKMNNSK